MLYAVPLCYHGFCCYKIIAGPPWKSLACYRFEAQVSLCLYNAMITVFTPDCNQISQSFYDSVINSIQFHQLVCPCGHAACLSIHGYYSRSVKTPDGSIKLRICRVKCSECGRTHALLLSSIVPYSQISLVCQQRICSDYENGRAICSVCNDCISIDENNVKSVLRNYRLRWRQMLRSLKIPLFPLHGLVCSCFSFYSVQFMQIHRMCNTLFQHTT